jgi:hypothetical protein
MNREEALEVIENYNPPSPTIKYYQDPYRDGYQDASGCYAEYPPVSSLLIDAVLERDKDCKEYIPDSECETDEKFNAEMEKRFTDLMSRAKDTAVEEYRKHNSHLYSMVTESHHNKITIIPMSLSTLCEFKEKCEKAASEIGLKSFYVYEHKDNQDTNGRMVYGSAPYGGFFMNNSAKNAFENMVRYCSYFKKYAKEYKSSNYEIIESLCDSINEHIESLYKIVNLDYIQRINNYIAKEQLSNNNHE